MLHTDQQYHAGCGSDCAYGVGVLAPYSYGLPLAGISPTDLARLVGLKSDPQKNCLCCPVGLKSDPQQLRQHGGIAL